MARLLKMNRKSEVKMQAASRGLKSLTLMMNHTCVIGIPIFIALRSRWLMIRHIWFPIHIVQDVFPGHGVIWPCHSSLWYIQIQRGKTHPTNLQIRRSVGHSVRSGIYCSEEHTDCMVLRQIILGEYICYRKCHLPRPTCPQNIPIIAVR